MSDPTRGPTVHDIALALERLNGRVDLISYQLQSREKERADYVPRPDHERIVADVAEMKRHIEEMRPKVQEMAEAYERGQETRMQLYRDVLKWGTLLLVAFILGCVVYVLGFGPNPLSLGQQVQTWMLSGLAGVLLGLYRTL
ncbi:MAG TPA: hypothetical protein VK002_15350 [Rubricoccaceae bacterium]|nr:hypothetical protein [Rubricoccaceae bacterium]